MRPRRVMETLLARWGEQAQILFDAEPPRTVRVLLQPIRQESKRYLEEAVGPFGRQERGRALCWAAPESAGLLAEGGQLQTADGRWIVRRRELVHAAGRPLYVWMVLQRGEEGTI